MLPKSVYAYIWQTTRNEQIRIAVLTLMVAPLTMVPLELQRRIVDLALGSRNLKLLALLGLTYFAVILVQGGLKYMLNLTRGRVQEIVVRDFRKRVIELKYGNGGPGHARHTVDDGTIVSVIAAESDDVGEFASDSVATPLLQTSTIIWVAGYLLWAQPVVAALAIVVYALQPFLVYRVQSRINHLSRRRTALVRRLGLNVIERARSAEPARSAHLRHAHAMVEQAFRLRIRIYRLKYFLTFLGNFLDALGPLVVLMVGGYLVLMGRIEVSILFVLISGFLRLADPWDSLVSYYRFVSNARVSYGLVADVVNGKDVEPNTKKS
jgi:ABC-type bacteriocin/lantibiotic exporter with double-glycine peptidase domain